MATGHECMHIIAARTTIPYGHVRNVARRLIETGDWPVSNGATVPQLSPQHVVCLLFALMRRAKAKSAGSLARHYGSLPGVLDGVRGTAGQYIERMLTAFLDLETTDFAKLAYHSEIELCTTAPAIRIRAECTDRPLELLFFDRGTGNNPWSGASDYIRDSVTLPGPLLFSIAADLRHVSRGNRHAQ